MNPKKLHGIRAVTNKSDFVIGANVVKEDDITLLPTSVVRKNEPKIFVYKKKRPISQKDNNWNISDAQKAIFLEQMFMERQQKNPTLIISFPDQNLSSSIVRGYSPNIDSVNFIQSAAPRYCYITLKPGSNVRDEIARISKIPFQNGFLKAKIRTPTQMVPSPNPREVDPSTLYVGNLPPDISVGEIKENFPKAIRIEVGYSLKKKWRRYALVKYATPEEAMHAFAVSYESNIRSTSIVVRFHRAKHWKILEEVEIQNEIARLKIKKEKVDEEYEAAIRRAQIGCHSAEGPLGFSDSTVAHLAPAQYPIARPLIDPSMIKKEPTTPEHVSDEVENLLNPSEQTEKWDQCMQLLQFMMLNQQQNQKRSQVQDGQQYDAQQQLFREQLTQCMQQKPQILNPISDSWKNFRVSGALNSQPSTVEKNDLSQKKRDSQQSKQCSMNTANLNIRKNTVDFGQAKIDIMKLPRIPKKRVNESTSGPLDTGKDSLTSTKSIQKIDNQSSSSSTWNIQEKEQRSQKTRFQSSLAKTAKIGCPSNKKCNDSKVRNTKTEPIEKPVKKRKRTI